jgi:hypothetical protein
MTLGVNRARLLLVYSWLRTTSTGTPEWRMTQSATLPGTYRPIHDD